VKPLAGVRVMDMSWLGPGCVTTWLLAELGAEVVKVEPPDGSDNVRNFPPFAAPGVAVGHLALDRGKRSLALDLRDEGAKEAYRRVAATADAVVEGFRPGVADRMGVGYARLRELRPSIVYCAVTGYGAGGPLSATAGHDLNYLAQAGLLAMSEGRPMPLPLQPADYLGAALAAYGVAAGVVKARATGEGTCIESSLFDGVLYSMVLPLSQSLTLGLDHGPGEHFLAGGVACYQVYACADGRHLTVAALEPKFWRRFVELVGLPVAYVERQNDPTFQDEMKRGVAAAIAGRTLDAWMEVFVGEDVCVAPVLGLAEAARQGQIAERGGIARVRHGGNDYEVLAGPLRVQGDDTVSDTSVATVPSVGADSRALLVEAECSEEMIADLEARRVLTIARED
jgi:alpha-methylacyl-CoA racemase